MIQTYKHVRRKYDGQKGTAIVNTCSDGTECGLAIFRMANERTPYKYPSPYGEIENISCDSYENTREMLQKGRWEIIA